MREIEMYYKGKRKVGVLKIPDKDAGREQWKEFCLRTDCWYCVFKFPCKVTGKKKSVIQKSESQFYKFKAKIEKLITPGDENEKS